MSTAVYRGARERGGLAGRGAGAASGGGGPWSPGTGCKQREQTVIYPSAQGGRICRRSERDVREPLCIGLTIPETLLATADEVIQ
jgi:hypothetical protein